MYLLAGRIAFFDLGESATETYTRALQAASQAEDDLLGSAVLGHLAFIPGWSQDREAAAEHLRAARAYARRGEASAVHLAWLEAVEAECAVRCGDHRATLTAIDRAEDRLASDPDSTPPEWMDWFNTGLLLGFKGNTQLAAGYTVQARTSLHDALRTLPRTSQKQRSVILGDLAAAEVADGNPEGACRYAVEALDQLATTWYATGMDRIRAVRQRLTPWEEQRCVRDLDDRLYDWRTTISSLQS